MLRSVLAFLAVALVLAGRADAASRSCTSGRTVFKHGSVRVFLAGGQEDVWYACGRSRRPVELYRTPGGLGDFRVHGLVGTRVLFEGAFSGEGGGQDTLIGWFDAKTSQAHSGELAGAVSNEVRDVVVAPDGGVGVVAALEDEHGLRVGYLAPGKRALRGELGLSTAPGYVDGSLAFAGSALTWRAAGQARTVVLGGEAVTCTSGTTLAETDGARLFEVLPARRTERGFQADVL